MQLITINSDLHYFSILFISKTILGVTLQLIMLVGFTTFSDHKDLNLLFCIATGTL